MRMSLENRGKSLASNFYYHHINDNELAGSIDELRNHASIFPGKGGTKTQRTRANEAEQQVIADIRSSTRNHNRAHNEFTKWDEEFGAIKRAAEQALTNPILKARVVVYDQSVQEVVQDNIERTRDLRAAALQSVIDTNAALVPDLQKEHVFE